MHLAAAQPDVLRAGNTRVIPAYGARERVEHRFPAALVGAAFTVGDRNIVLIREKAGEIRRGKRLEFGIVVGLNGIHMRVRHPARSVHRHLFKGHRTVAADLEMVGLRDLPIAGAENARARRVVARMALRLTVEHPEGDINALDLLDLVLGGKRSRQEGLVFIVPPERIDRVLAAELEGQNIVRPQRPGKLPRHDGRVAAVRAGGRGGVRIADELRTAGRTGIGLHPGGIRAPVGAHGAGVPRAAVVAALRGGIRRFKRLGGLCFLFPIQRLDLCNGVRAAAVIAFQFPGRAGIVQRPGAGRALVVGHLCRHRHSSFPIKNASVSRGEQKHCSIFSRETQR